MFWIGINSIFVPGTRGRRLYDRRSGQVLWLLTSTVLWLAGIAPPVSCGAQVRLPSYQAEAGEAGDEQPRLEFRRVFVPADRVDDVTHEQERFLPIHRDEFERLTAGLREDHAPPSVRVTRASFSARLEGSSLGQGTAELEVQHVGELPAWLPLQTRGLALSNLRWADGRPLDSGTYHGHDGQPEETGVIVTDPGTLHFAWTASGTPMADGAEFRLTFPDVVATELTLILPSSTRLTADGASIRSRAPDEAGRTAYLLAVRGGASVVLRTAGRPTTGLDSSGGLTVRHTTMYAITASATQVESQLRVAPLVQPIREMVIRVPTSTHVLSLTLGGQPLAFTERPSPDAVDEKLLSVELVQPLPAGETELRVRGMATTQLDRLMTLPSFRLAQSTWLGGTVHLDLDEGLQLHDLVHDGFRPKAADGRESGPENGTTFEQTNDGASLQVQVGRAPKRLTTQALTSIEIGREEILADATVDVTCENGAESILRAELVEGWEIGSVESQPAGLVRSWSLERDAGGGDTSRSVIVVMDRPVTRLDPVRLRFRARRQRSLNDEGYSMAQLTLLRLDRTSSESHWIEVVSGNTLEVLPEGTVSAQTVTPNELPPGLRSLVSDRRDAYLLPVRPETEGIVFGTRPRSADVAAEIRLEAEVTGTVVRHAYRFRIQPQSGAVSRLGIVLSEPPPAALQWRFIDETGKELAAERTSGRSARRRRGPAASRTLRWRIAQPVAGPFELLLSFERKWDGTSDLTFAAVEAAASQTGEVWLSADAAIRLAVENRGLDPLDAQAASEEEDLRRSFAYRFQPERVLRRDAGPPLTIRRVGAEDLAPAAWIRTARLDSVYVPDGKTSHTLSLLLESNGLEQLDVHLPSVERILFRTGGGAWRQLARTSAAEPFGIPLGDEAGTIPLEIRFSERQRALGSVASLEPMAIRFSIPTAQIEQHVWVPRGYRPIELSGSAYRLLNGLWTLGDAPPTPAVAAAPGGPVGSALAWEVRELRSTVRGDTVEVVHVMTLRLWCLAVLVLGFTLGTFLSRMRRRFAFAAAASGFSLALVLPAAYAPLASALAWGCIAAVLVHAAAVPLASLIRQWLFAGPRPQEAVATIAFLLLAFGLGSDGSSAEPGTDDAPANIYRVIDPIDEDRRPAGNYVFAPDTLYAALLRREREQRAPLGHWLIKRSHVRGALAADSDTAAASSPAFSLALELETFHRDAEIRLPFGRSLQPVRVTSIRVDGAVPANRWSDDGRSLYIRIPQPGPHHLELRILPHVRRKGGSRELSLPLVPIGECHVEVAVPEGMSPLTFPGAEGDIQYAPTVSMYRGHVGPVPELRIAWPAPSGTSNASAQADLLTWIYIQRSVALFEQRLVVYAEGDEPLYVDVVPPAGTRYVPSGRELPYASISATANGRVSLVIQPQEAESVVIPLQFLQEHPAGTMFLSMPRFTIEGGVQVVDRWVAVQAAPQLALRPEPGRSAEIMEPEAFLDRWGPADTLPDLAFRAYPDATPWRIGLDVRGPYVEVLESTTAIASPSGIAVRYRADVRVLDGTIMLRRLDVPSQMIISGVEIERDGAIQSARWSETEDGRLRILFPEPISGSFTLRVDGEVPAGEEGEIVLPLLSLDAQKSDTPRLTVARTAGTALELERSDALEPMAGASPPAPWQSDWYLHGQYVVDAASGEALLVRGTVRPAAPPSEARIVTTLVPDLRGWTVGVHCLLRGIQQPLDRLVFVVPQEFAGPYEVDPAERWQVEVLEESLHHRIVVTPLSAPAGEVRLTLRGQLAADRQEQVTIPAVRLVEPVADEALVALPRTTSSGQPAVWQISNLIGVEDAAADEMIGNPEEWALYRPSADPATARISLLEQSPSVPLVSFVDAVAHLRPQRPVFSQATFTLDPRGRRSCEILLPEGHRLLDIRVNGRRLSSYRLAARRWKVQLDSSQLPQLITVAYHSESTVEGTHRHLSVPRFIADGTAIPVLQTAWHVMSDRPWRPDEAAANGTSPISGSMLAAVRTANLIESLDEVLPALVASPMEIWYGWLAYWRDRIAAAQERYVARTRSEPLDEDAAQAVQAAQQRLARIAEALPHLPRRKGGDAAGERLRPSPSRSTSAHDLYLLGDGRVESIRVRALDNPRDETAPLWVGAVLLGLIGVGLAQPHRDDDAGSRSWGIAFSLPLLFLLAVWVLLADNLAAVIAVLIAVVVVLAWDARHVVGWGDSGTVGREM